MQKPWHKSCSEVLEELGTTEEGLSLQFIMQNDQRGNNKLQEAPKESFPVKLLHQLKDTMTLVLIAAAIVSALVAAASGDSSGYADVTIIIAVVILNALLGVFQETKAENAVEALKNMTAATANVIRDGVPLTIKAEDIVEGDVLVLEAGNNVPADCRILEAAALKINESALTGETTDIEKRPDLIPDDGAEVPLGDRTNMAYMGTIITNGRAQAVATSIGMNTEIGKIAATLNATSKSETPLQKKLNEISRVLSIVVLGLCVFIFAFSVLMNLIRHEPVTFNSMLSSFMVAVSLAVAAIPEGLTAVVTLVLSIGVTRMSKKNAIVKKLSAVETLGCAGIICSDKTGTLTQNKMTVTEVYTPDEHQLAEAMLMCNDCTVDGRGQVLGEATEKALTEYAMKIGFSVSQQRIDQPRVNEIPFDSDRKLMSTLHTKGNSYIQYTKGAPDIVLSRCTSALRKNGIVPMNDEIRQEILQKNKAYADNALRVLAAAIRIPSNKDDIREEELCLLGLTAMIDPVRPEVKPAIDRCVSAGIRPVMITGDHKDTAVAIARELGMLEKVEQAITGADLNLMAEDELDARIHEFSVYARVQPEHKIRIVKAWQKRGQIVAMTGDGVNDAPAIKAADIGVGMGITGTDVTKQAADMILADDNFATIVGAVEEGRKVYANIRSAIQFLLSSNLSEIVAILGATIFGITLFKPSQLLWVNLVTDCLPAIAISMEAAAADNMLKKPRSASESIFADHMGIDILWQGVMISVLVLLAYASGHSAGAGTTMAFLVLALAEVFHSFNLRSRTESLFTLKHQNWWCVGAAALSCVLTAAVVFIPPIAKIFGFAALSGGQIARSLLLAVLVIPIVEASKLLRKLRQR